MNKEFMVALITGLFGAVIAPLITQVGIPLIRRLFGLNAKAQPSKGGPKRKPGRPKSLLLHTAAGGLGGILLGYFLILPFIASPCPPFASTKVNITSPRPDSSVPRLVTVQGTSCHIRNGEELWLLVVPEGVTAYYPQPSPVVISTDGNWSASAYIGLDKPVDVGRGFVLIAALADQQGSAAIRTYFSQARSDFKGLEPLPDGIRIMSQVRVVRR